MRSILWAAGLLVGVMMTACAPGGAGAGSGQMGDLPTDDGSVGGISEVPNPSAEMSKASGTSVDRLQRGHSIYMLQCGQCHEYMLPENLFEDEWEDAMPKMIRHAGLGSEDEKAVLDYVLAVKKMKG